MAAGAVAAHLAFALGVFVAFGTSSALDFFACAILVEAVAGLATRALALVATLNAEFVLRGLVATASGSTVRTVYP